MKIDPDYLAVPLEAVRYYLPRWHGKPGDLEKFIEQTTEQTHAAGATRSTRWP
ncbi:MAG: hypothetical protein QM775_29455 [Pirellulales bacterium]